MLDTLSVPLTGKMSYADITKLLAVDCNAIIDDEYPDTNGWQVDYWKNFTIGTTSYVLSGSMYYGDYTIEENNEEGEFE